MVDKIPRNLTEVQELKPHITHIFGFIAANTLNTNNQESLMPILSSLVVPQVVIMVSSGANSEDKVGIIITVSFRWLDGPIHAGWHSEDISAHDQGV